MVVAFWLMLDVIAVNCLCWLDYVFVLLLMLLAINLGTLFLLLQMKTKRKLVPKSVVMGSVRETGYLDVRGSCSGNVVERESAVASVDNPNFPLTTDVVCDVHVGGGLVRIVNDRQTGSVDVEIAAQMSQLLKLNNDTVADREFVGVTGTSPILHASDKNNRSDEAGASLGQNQKRSRDVTCTIRESSHSNSSSSTRRRLSVNHRNLNTSNLNSPPSKYKYIGKCEHLCEHCGGRFCDLRRDIVEGLIELLDNHNALVQLFRTAREKLLDEEVSLFKVRLYSVVGAREYELPIGDTLGAVVYESGPNMDMDYDIVIEERFGASSSEDRRLTMKAYYSYMLHDRVNSFNYLSKTGRLFQQYMVTAFCADEQNRIDWIREHQNDIRNDYLSGIYDAINRGDSDGFDFGGKLILPQSFTDFPGLTTADRADVVDRVFEMKIRQFVKYLRDNHEDIDAFISAELPLPEVDPVCYRIVLEFIIHGPCGEICPTAACMKNGPKCAKYFLKEYCDHTYMDHDGFVHYRRRDTGATTVKQNV
uniref:DNA helicase n=1 Tax=Tanacetum cinerariifolium TaxID=118510 RepID=A0A6L2L2Z1_TANCI|nr:DNA helicase [Tanacetum cinerariifolium]